MLDAPIRPRAAIFRLPGLAAAVWIIGLLIGLLALIAGDAGLAVVVLVVAVAAPWAGIAWLSRS